MIIREALPAERAVVGELRVAAYRALGLLPEGSRYAETLRGFGFDDGCAVLVAAQKTGDDIVGTITLEPFGPASELAADDTEADIRAFAVAPHAQGQGVGRMLLLAVIEHAQTRGVRRLRLCTQPARSAARSIRSPARYCEPRLFKIFSSIWSRCGGRGEGAASGVAPGVGRARSG